MQALISLSTLFGILKLAGKLGLNINKTRLFLALILVFYPSQLIHCNFVMSDILFQSLLFWAFYYSYQLLHHQTYKNAFISVLFFMLAMLTKPVAFLLGFTLLLVLAIAFSRKNKIKYVLPFLLLPLTYHAYCSYNERVTGYYHYSSVTPVFVLKYMAKYTNAQLFGEAYADSVQDHIMAIANAQVVYADRYNLMNAEGTKIITEHKTFFMWFNIKGWVAFMLDPGRFEWVHFLNLKEGNYPGLYHVVNTEGLVKGLWIFIKNAPLVLLFILLISFIWNAFISALLLVFFFSRNISWQLRLWVFLFVAYIIGSTGVLGLSRYRIAVAPMLWIAALYVIQLWLIHRADRKENLMYVD